MKNQIDCLTFQQKVDLVTSANSTPKGQGLVFPLSSRRFNAQIVLQRTGNKLQTRYVLKELIKNTVAAFVDRIENGQYRFTYEQPVVKDLGNKNEVDGEETPLFVVNTLVHKRTRDDVLCSW